ncbi:MAG TPA: MoxR family ATPase [Gemmatimonadales bacterium]
MAGPSTVTADEVARAQATLHRLHDQLGRVVLGQEGPVRELLVALTARGHVLLEGVPGTAKTLLIRVLGECAGLDFRRIQFTPDLMPSDISGVSLLEGAGAFRFRPGPLFTDLCLADEVNRAPAKTQAALLEAMQERSVTVDGQTHALPAPFTVFATQNPVEFEGTYPLPEAELDRFLVKVMVGYPDAATEQGILARVLGGFESDDPRTYGVERVLDRGGLADLQRVSRGVTATEAVQKYIAAVVRATRSAAGITMGASPRATVALLKAGQATALLDGRSYVSPDDVKSIAPAVLRHRIVVAPELELEGVTADQALETVLEGVEAPR